MPALYTIYCLSGVKDCNSAALHVGFGAELNTWVWQNPEVHLKSRRSLDHILSIKINVKDVVYKENGKKPENRIKFN